MMSETNSVSPIIPLAVLTGAYILFTREDMFEFDEVDEEYPLAHIVLYIGFLYYMREHLAAPEVLAIMAPLAASNIARSVDLSYNKSTLVALAVLLVVRHTKGDLTVTA